MPGPFLFSLEQTSFFPLNNKILDTPCCIIYVFRFQPQKENFGFDVLSLFLASPLRTYIAWKLAEMRSRGGRTRNRDVCFGVKTVANFGMEKKKGKMRWFVQWLPS